MTIQTRYRQADDKGRRDKVYQVTVYNKYLGKKEYVGTFERKRDAESAELDAKQRIRAGTPVHERREIGFSDFVDRWLEVLNVRETTRKEYTHTTNHLREYFKNRPVSGITKEHVQRFVSQKASEGYSDRYIRKMATRLSQVMNTAVEWGYLTVSPTSGGIRNLPKEPRREIHPLTAEETRRLIEAAPEYWRPAFLALVACGLRRSELFGLTHEDVDLETGLLTVKGQLVNGELSRTKTQAGSRTIPIPMQLRDALRSHLLRCPPNELGLLFPTENGYPVNPSNFYKRVWKPTVLAAGVRPDLKMHDLRKQFASVQVRQRRSAAYLQSVMGHRSAVTTLTWYAGVFEDELEAAAKDMGDWLAEEAASNYRAMCS